MRTGLRSSCGARRGWRRVRFSSFLLEGGKHCCRFSFPFFRCVVSATHTCSLFLPRAVEQDERIGDVEREEDERERRPGRKSLFSSLLSTHSSTVPNHPSFPSSLPTTPTTPITPLRLLSVPPLAAARPSSFNTLLQNSPSLHQRASIALQGLSDTSYNAYGHPQPSPFPSSLILTSPHFPPSSPSPPTSPSRLRLSRAPP